MNKLKQIQITVVNLPSNFSSSQLLFDHRCFFFKSLQHPHKATLKTLPQQNEFKLKT